MEADIQTFSIIPHERGVHGDEDVPSMSRRYCNLHQRDLVHTLRYVAQTVLQHVKQAQYRPSNSIKAPINFPVPLSHDRAAHRLTLPAPIDQ